MRSSPNRACSQCSLSFCILRRSRCSSFILWASKHCMPRSFKKSTAPVIEVVSLRTTTHQDTSTILTTTQDPWQTILKEVNIFTKNMTQLAQAMHARMTKAEYERDVAQGKISHSTAMNVADMQSARQLGRPRSRNVEAKSFTAPIVPPFLPPPQTGENITFRMYQPNVPKRKATKTDARKALTGKLRATNSKSTLPKGSATPWNKPSVSSPTPLDYYNV